MEAGHWRMPFFASSDDAKPEIHSREFPDRNIQGPQPILVQFGCGWSVSENWHNFDASPTLWFERLPLVGRFCFKNAERFPTLARYGDIVKGLPFAPGSVDCVYASHVLEHLCHRDCLTALRNTWRMLKPGGVFRLIVPDLSWRVDAYVRAREVGKPHASTELMRSTMLGIEEEEPGAFGMLKRFLGRSRHLWMWDERSLTEALKGAGFQSVRRCRFGDAAHPAFAELENEGRFFEDGNPELALEAIA